MRLYILIRSLTLRLQGLGEVLDPVSKDEEADNVAVARFLRTCPGLSKAIIGDLLGQNNDRCLRVLDAFTHMFDFSGALLASVWFPLGDPVRVWGPIIQATLADPRLIPEADPTHLLDWVRVEGWQCVALKHPGHSTWNTHGLTQALSNFSIVCEDMHAWE